MKKKIGEKRLTLQLKQFDLCQHNRLVVIISTLEAQSSRLFQIIHSLLLILTLSFKQRRQKDSFTISNDSVS